MEPTSKLSRAVLAVLILVPVATSQFGGAGAGGFHPPSTTSGMGIEQNQMGLWMNESDDDKRRAALENFSDSISKFDLKAPGGARREYEKGTQLLLKKSFADAVDHFVKAIAAYPDFVAAHNALGSAYLDLGRNDEAQKEFAQSVALDGHLAHSFMNLGRAQMALKDFSGAQSSMQKASELAPLDIRLLSALTYTQFLNKDYPAAVATAQRVHNGKHDSAAIVHYFAAASWQQQNNLEETVKQLEALLDEDPKSPAAASARAMMDQIKEKKDRVVETVKIGYSTVPDDPNVSADARGRMMLKELEQKRQVAQVEGEPDADCETCTLPSQIGTATGPILSSGAVSRRPAGVGGSAAVLHSAANEVAVFFAVTDHGKSVSDLTQQEVVIRDDGKPPARIYGLRNESQLHLRLGLVIDTSSSITKEFPFEQKAAASFAGKTATDQNDLAFVVGFSSEVLMVQDFTSDEAAVANGIESLAPKGGTAIWDAVKFSAEKLASHKDEQPSAKILVVISDGADNSSSATLKEAIETAERNEVIVYTVSTREFAGESDSALVADHAMKALASRTGGASFFPSSLGDLDKRLSDLQQVIRSRYLISYKPAEFETNARYRPISIAAQKSGHKLHVYARRGYYANPKPTS